MVRFGKTGAFLLSAVLSISLLTGCVSNADKNSAKETVEGFLQLVASGSTEGITDYCTDEVASGDFVKLFDSGYLADQILADQDTSSLTEETLNELDEFCKLFSNMVTAYEVKEITANDDKSITAIATITTDFPVDIIKSSSTSEKVMEAAGTYSTEHEEEIAALYAEEGEETTQKKILNDVFLIALETYEDLIRNSSPQDYAIALKLEKNAETDSYVITEVTDYLSAAEGATTAAEDTTVD
ncbi:hypothetical protein [Butyrivibrio sp. MC2021]|uniref:hypothetical protein n=1 Tax=Butyrivibrio sp. MC2021 TaxID=1408306 RepID=UPI00047B5A5F|nr:hypothetical protein [Butyrivibrio sp. MC2021]